MSTTPNARFTGKVAFVTGAGNGIGRATAVAFAQEGASVVVADLSTEHSRDTVVSIEQIGGRVIAVGCDVADGDQVRAALQDTVEAFGRLDIAFNNAGIALPTGAVADITEDEWDRTIDINLRGVFLCMKHEIPLMLEHGGGGAIVNTSSGAGIRGSREAPLTGLRSSVSLASPSVQRSTTPRPGSGSTRSAQVSSTPT
jgi:NAD(P)-dependent dehydrogenase (short-subunit alcohol dehydrogenase family)